ncbi:hypothetical protein HYU18_01720 [Candidatus Woesearchaeota archaeon]|nr:hypothetical protein [Candidatus Woesearchaeota archaeon]
MIRVKFGKRGLFDIEDFFSFVVYILILFMFVILLSLPKCSPTAEQKLTSDVSRLDRLHAEQELSEMLRTQLPGNLPALIESKKSLKINGLEIYYRVKGYAGAKGALEANPGLYTGLTYAQFIDRLEFLEGVSTETKNSIFQLVTRAVFVKDVFPPHIKELDLEERSFLIYPEVYVKYGVAGKFYYESDADLSNLPIFYGGTYGGEAIAVIPLTDQSKKPAAATVALRVEQGVLSSLAEGS